MWFKKKKKSRRRVFGFLCTPELSITIKWLARQLRCPIYCVVEHALQLGGAAIAEATMDKETKSNLEEHLLNEHLLKPEFYAENEYDRKVLASVRESEKIRQEYEQCAKEFLKIAEEENIHPNFLLAFSKSMIVDLRERRRRKGDIPMFQQKYKRKGG